ncbi:MAG: fimbrillin family protein [Bacteroidaceae bacterium]|nr:fimbrillin family protein [Bacteroidaceae bacterium]
MKRLCHIYFLLTALLTLAGCAQETDYPFLEPESVSQYPIKWSINSINTRALVNNDLLKSECTPVEDGSNESVGVWGQYTKTINGQQTTIEEFVATPLTYGSDEFDSNIYSHWDYPGEARYWMNNAVYEFRACYPQKLMTSLMTQMDATIFQGGPINTLVLQEDILLAATQIDTKSANLAAPVKLNMQHAFAAIKFKVKAVKGFVPADNEGITSCWLQNKNNNTNLFSPSGYLVHSGYSIPEITWYPYESSTAPMYLWKHEGVGFYRENTLYTPNYGLTGEEFTHNDGWILIVPQTVKSGTLQFCYTLRNAGNQIFSVEIPNITYEEGVKYTYMLEISGSEAKLNLTITPWNYIESSYDITM